VEPGLIHDGTDPCQRKIAASERIPEQDIVPASARVRPSSTRMSVVLPAPLGRGSRRRILGDKELHAVDRDVLPKRLVRPWVSTAHCPSRTCAAYR